ncbi:MAG TPA: phosphate regulon sensor histidine kinase PhoR [Pasteurellaceae bacterium]|nr:phosphate regulon sensor histidine kinase PhoR [Pasteurellaceae bacterium]
MFLIRLKQYVVQVIAFYQRNNVNNWYSKQIQSFLLACVIGLALGLIAKTAFSFPLLTSILGGILLSITMLWLWNLQNISKIMQWLQEDHITKNAPIQSFNLWSELTRRIIKSLRGYERQIKYEREQLDMVLSALQIAPVGLILLDKQNRVVWGNTNAGTYLGLSFPRDYEQQITNLMRQPVVIAFFDSLHDTLHPKPIQIRFGEENQNTLSITVVPYGSTQRKRKLMMLQDITEHERADRMRKDFVANVSHEIRTPLTVLAGFIEIMQTLPLDKSDQEHYLKLMAEQSTRMHHLITDLLTLAKLEEGPPPQTETLVPVKNLMEKVQQTALQLSAGKHHIIFIENTAMQRQIAGEETELISALTNLVANAVRYTPVGSEISVSWNDAPDGSGTLSVKDNGPGIAKEHLTRLSERFYRVDRSRSRQTGGTGLGLSIVKRIMQRHDGLLSIESKVGEGAQFSLKFPAKRIRSN